MSDHFRSSFSLANKTPHALSSSKSINIDTIVTILETILRVCQESCVTSNL